MMYWLTEEWLKAAHEQAEKEWWAERGDMWVAQGYDNVGGKTCGLVGMGITCQEFMEEHIARAAVRKTLQAVEGLVLGDSMQSDCDGPFYVRVDAEGLEAFKKEVGL